MMTNEEFVTRYVNEYDPNGEQRAGQFAMNLLHECHPTLYRWLTGGVCDPFHNDAKMYDFWLIIERMWDRMDMVML